MGVNARFVVVTMSLLAFWPVWPWYFTRVVGSPDDGWGLLAWVAIAAMCYRQRHERLETGTVSLPVCALTLLYAAAYPFFPPLLRAVLAVSAIAIVLSNVFFNVRCHLGLLILALLSLPVIPSLQFYLGYPLRELVGQVAAPLLSLGGLVVTAEGSSLQWNGALVWIDAPCSGIKMLWAGLFLTAVLVGIYRMSFARSLLALFAAGIVIIAANIFRALGLFYIEAGIVAVPAWMHTGVGVASFAVAAVGIAVCVVRLKESTSWRAASSIS